MPFSRGRRRPDPARVAEFAATARKLQQEREQSAGIVARLLRDTPKEQWAGLAQHAELHNSGALEVLGQESLLRLHRDPNQSLVIAEIETSIAALLADDAYPAVVLAQLRAHAWKDRGQALWYLARYDDALDALDRAEHILEPFGTVAHDLAIVHYLRAVTLQDVRRFDESLALLASCKAIFHDHGDTRRHLRCGIAEGLLLHRMHRYREAREVYVMLLDAATKASDLCGKHVICPPELANELSGHDRRGWMRSDALGGRVHGCVSGPVRGAGNEVSGSDSSGDE